MTMTTETFEINDQAPDCGVSRTQGIASPPVEGKGEQVRVAIMGGGTAGVAVAAALRRQLDSHHEIVLIEPSLTHHYQPGFTLVGGGVRPLAWARRNEAELIPAGVRWIRQRVIAVDPDRNRLELADERVVQYDYLVACPGLELQWERIPGLGEALGDGRVCSIYSPESAANTWERIRALNGGRALFTQAPMPIKCPGAPQKIVYLAADHWRRSGVREQIELRFCTAAPSLFSVAEYVPTLEGVADRHGVHVEYSARLVQVDGADARATFERTAADGSTERWSESYDLLHAVPPQGPTAVIRNSPLGDADGWLDVDQETLRHQRYPNVFGIGDATSVPTSKTAAAVRAQLPVVVANLCAAIAGNEPALRYSGYASCPLITCHGKVVLAEFVYGRKLAPSLPWDSTRERRSAWWLKTRLLPWMYWKRLLRGVDLPLVARH